MQQNLYQNPLITIILLAKQVQMQQILYQNPLVKEQNNGFTILHENGSGRPRRLSLLLHFPFLFSFLVSPEKAVIMETKIDARVVAGYSENSSLINR